MQATFTMWSPWLEQISLIKTVAISTFEKESFIVINLFLSISVQVLIVSNEFASTANGQLREHEGQFCLIWYSYEFKHTIHAKCLTFDRIVPRYVAYRKITQGPLFTTLDMYPEITISISTSALFFLLLYSVYPLSFVNS